MTVGASVRVRVTVVAVAVTTVALLVGGWALLRAVERTQIARIARGVEQQVDEVAAQLRAGVPPEALVLPAPSPMFGFVQVIDNTGGDVLTATPGLPTEDPIVMVVGDVALGPGDVGTGVVATDLAGSARVEGSLPGTFETAIPLQLTYEQVEAADGRTLTVAAASPLGEVQRSIDAIRRALWVALPAVVALVGGVAWVVTGRALRPVESIRAEVDEISSSTLHRRVPEPPTGDEVGRLARTMNQMLDRVEAAVEHQRRFVADASHELRSPVAALRAQLEVARHVGGLDELRAAVDAALAEEARLEDLLADLLLLASVDEGAAPPTAPVDLAALVTAEAAARRRVPVTVAGTGVVTGSATHLRRVVANLLDNAARHAATNVAVTVDGGRVVVDDDGPGVPDEDRERVFERFTRLDAGRSRDHGGAGLGLSLVRAVVTAHGGTTWIETSPSGGARVVVDLPAG